MKIQKHRQNRTGTVSVFIELMQHHRVITVREFSGGSPRATRAHGPRITVQLQAAKELK